MIGERSDSRRGTRRPWDELADLFAGAPDRFWEADRRRLDRELRDPWVSSGELAAALSA